MFIVLAGTNNNNSGRYDPDLHLSFHPNLESARVEFENWNVETDGTFQVNIINVETKEVVDSKGWNEDGWEEVRGELELK